MSTFTVANTSEDGSGSLRDAVDQANDHAGSDTIQFNSGLSGETITLTSGQLELTDTNGTTTITGLGANKLTVSGGGERQPFAVYSGVTVNISDLTISDGYVSGVGGGIFNAGTLTITGSIIKNNTAGWSQGANRGGGIANSGTLTITNSTLSGNIADEGGGGIYNGAFSTITITNTTFNRNKAHHAGGGGIFNITNGTLTLNNTIIANSTGGDLYNIGGMSGSYNLIENGDTDGLDPNTTITDKDPMLGSLTNNGGPTLTFALKQGSPAIDAGGNSLAVDADGNPLTTDQRGEGYARFVGTVDIGAFEVQTSTSAAATLAVGGEPISDTIALTRGGSLIVAGTDGDDDIFVQHGREPGTIRVIVRTPGSPISLDTFRTGAISRLFLSGRGGDDQLINLTSIAEVMWGGGGDDFLFGNQGQSILFAGAGNDLVVAGAGNDYVDGGNGQDTIFGGSEADRLFGGAGEDTIVGEGGVDIALGQAGQDNILDETGEDDIDGGDAVESLVAGAANGILASEAGEVTRTGGDGAALMAGFDETERWRDGVSDETEFDEDEFWSEWDPADNFATLDDELSIERELNQLSLV